MGWLTRIFGSEADGYAMPPKDPKDLTLTANSRAWEPYEHCPKCKQPITHNEIMSQICNSCGTIGYIWNRWATRRKIWTGSRWIYQYNFPQGGHRFYEDFPPKTPTTYDLPSPTPQQGDEA